MGEISPHFAGDMANLRDTRSGWENEHLARFLLSRVSFLASPLFVGDDVGVDVVCTLFEPRNVVKKETGRESEQLFPRQAFALQLKSSFEEIEVTSASSSLPRLELPFFLGVIDCAHSCLDIYSGELLPDYFSSVKEQDKFLLAPQNETFEHKPEWKWPTNKVGTFKVPMPHIVRLSVGETDAQVDATGKVLLQRCEMMLKNIATRIGEEYVFRYNTFARIIAGPRSEAHFRENFMLRLAEGFYNLRYLFDDRRGEFRRDEFDALEVTYLQCKALNYPRQDFVEMVYGDLKRALEAEATVPAPKA